MKNTEKLQKTNKGFYLLIPQSFMAEIGKKVGTKTFNHMDACLLGTIIGLSKTKGYCYARNSYLASCVKRSMTQITESIGKLAKGKFIEVVGERENRKIQLSLSYYNKLKKIDPNIPEPPLQNENKAMPENRQTSTGKPNDYYNCINGYTSYNLEQVPRGELIDSIILEKWWKTLCLFSETMGTKLPDKKNKNSDGTIQTTKTIKKTIGYLEKMNSSGIDSVIPIKPEMKIKDKRRIFNLVKDSLELWRLVQELPEYQDSPCWVSKVRSADKFIYNVRTGSSPFKWLLINLENIGKKNILEQEREKRRENVDDKLVDLVGYLIHSATEEQIRDAAIVLDYRIREKINFDALEAQFRADWEVQDFMSRVGFINMFGDYLEEWANNIGAIISIKTWNNFISKMNEDFNIDLECRSDTARRIYDEWKIREGKAG